MIESLTSYLTRLAQAHDVSTRTLIAEYLRFHIPTAELTAALQTRKEWPRHFLEDAHTLNGMTNRVKDWIFALEESTGVANLQFSTMVIWKGIFSNRGLLRSRRAWCGSCYQEWQASGGAIYEPLLWALADVSSCPVHKRSLTENCPRCKYRPHVLMPRSRPGCCPHCQHWFGGEHRQDRAEGADSGPDDTHIKTDGPAQLLARAPLLHQLPSKDLMWANLQGCVCDLAGGNGALFGRAAGVSTCTLALWFAGRKLPSFASLNKVCYRLGIPLFRFLTEKLTAGDPDWEKGREIVRQHRTQVQANKSCYATLPKPNSARTNVSDREIEKALQHALRQSPLPTIRQIASKLGMRPGSIYARFPGFHKILRAARQSRLEAAANAALLESPPPTLRELEKQRGFPRKTLRACFPGLYQELAVRSAQRRYRRREEIKGILQAVCAEEPPPSGRALAARLGRNPQHLKRTFPEIWQQILQRHAAYQKLEITRKRAAFTERVRRIATDLLVAGKYPSRRRVLALMGDSELRGEHSILAELKRLSLLGPSSSGSSS